MCQSFFHLTSRVFPHVYQFLVCQCHLGNTGVSSLPVFPEVTVSDFQSKRTGLPEALNWTVTHQSWSFWKRRAMTLLKWKTNFGLLVSGSKSWPAETNVRGFFKVTMTWALCTQETADAHLPACLRDMLTYFLRWQICHLILFTRIKDRIHRSSGSWLGFQRWQQWTKVMTSFV